MEVLDVMVVEVMMDMFLVLQDSENQLRPNRVVEAELGTCEGAYPHQT